MRGNAEENSYFCWLPLDGASLIRSFFMVREWFFVITVHNFMHMVTFWGFAVKFQTAISFKSICALILSLPESDGVEIVQSTTSNKN